MEVKAEAAVATPRRFVTVRTEIAGLDQPDAREGRAQMLDRSICATLQEAVERLIVVEAEAHLGREGRALRALLERLFRHFSGRDVARDGLDADDAAFDET